MADDLHKAKGGKVNTKEENKKESEPETGWTDKFGRTRAYNNIYQIEDVEASTCGCSNEFCTPQSGKNCGICVCVLSVYAMILCIISLSSGMSSFNTEWGLASCPPGDDETVSDRIDTYLGWNYLSAGIIVCCIVGLIGSIYLCWYNKPFVIKDDRFNKNDDKKVEIEDYDVTKARYCCIFNVGLWIAILIFIICWWMIMITVYQGILYIANAENCTDDKLQEDAQDKIGIFIALFLFSVPIIVAIVLSFCALCFVSRDALCVSNK